MVSLSVLTAIFQLDLG